jgi:homoserine O-succinyltransferase/O-acetyltransferase
MRKMRKNQMKIAILDLYEGESNEGMRCIQQLVHQFKAIAPFPVFSQVFDVRRHLDIADLGFDVYISSGGPGSPLTTIGSAWELKYFALMDGIIQHNHNHPSQKKFVFLICHSIQVFCRHYGYAKVTKRKSTSFGVMPVHKTREGKKEPLFLQLSEPFYVVDSRDYQIVEPNEAKIRSSGGNVLCIEKERPLIPFERAVMAIRFSEAIIGTQFHPEVDSDGMHRYLLRDDKKKIVTEKYGERKYVKMLQMLKEADKIKLTQRTILPNFLQLAASAYSGIEV